MNILLTQLTQTNDFVVKFTVIECLNELIKNDYNVDLNYDIIISTAMKVIVELLKNLRNPTFFWKLSNFIGNLLDKCKESPNMGIMTEFNNLPLEEIIQRNSNIMKSVFAEIFKKILIGSPNPTFIFSVSWRFLQCGLQVLDADEADIIIGFWLTFLRQIDVNRSPLDQEILVKMFELFGAKYQKLWRFADKEENFSGLLLLLEEYLLAGYPFEGINEFLRTVYDKCCKGDKVRCNRLKTDFFSVIMSYFLMKQVNNKLEEADLKGYLEMSYSEMCQNNENLTLKSEIQLKNQVTALFCRMVLINTEAVFSFITSMNLTQDQFFHLLQVGSNFFSKHTLNFNLLINYFPLMNIILGYIETICYIHFDHLI